MMSLSGKFSRGSVVLLLGVIGLTAFVIGTFYPPSFLQKVLYLVGALLLTSSAALDKNIFFTVLEVVVVVGTFIAFFPLSALIKAGVPAALTLLAILYLWHMEEIKNLLGILGCIGLLLLAAGFATSESIVYFFGSLVLSTYSIIVFLKNKDKLAMIFVILNVFFALGSLGNIFGY
ncbi:MAG: hypothetical protein JXR42_05670 [Gammaproteobacteria bacterium]|nr:hypothetical protein [Gammaproteobacteria bacterium]